MSLSVTSILCRAGIMDNYAYVISDEDSGVSAIVDASEAAPIEAYCDKTGMHPDFILVTHHHDDHVAGNKELKEKYGLKIVVPAIEADKIAGADILVNGGDIFKLGRVEAQVIGAAGHTQGHILWYFSQEKKLFTGDVLFNLCIGGLFEGTPRQMWQSLQKIKNLPDDVLFYPGHEYTQANIRQLYLNNETEYHQYLELLKQKHQNREALVGMPLRLEKSCNPYLKVEDEAEFCRYFEGA